jgi:hypothetical protein
MAVNPSSPSVRAGEEEGRAANQQEAARYAASPLHSTFFNLFSQSHYRGYAPYFYSSILLQSV